MKRSYKDIDSTVFVLSICSNRLQKQYRSRTDVAFDQGLHCLPFIQQILDESTGSEMCFLEVWKELELSDYLLRVQYFPPKYQTDRPEQNVALDQSNYTPLGTQ